MNEMNLINKELNFSADDFLKNIETIGLKEGKKQ
jgi:hypothetical protein